MASCALICCTHLARKVPTNYILLFVYTVSTTVVLSFVTSYYYAHTVVMAMMLTCGIVLALTLYAATTKRDFTVMGGLLFCGIMVLIMMTFLLSFSYDKTLNIILCSLGLFVYSIYLIMDT